MKKLLTVLSLSLALFAAACGGSSASYDFSSGESFGKSVAAQAKAEGITETEAQQIVGAYTVVLLADKAAEMEAIPEAEREAYVMDLLKKNIGSKTLVQLLDEVEKATK